MKRLIALFVCALLLGLLIKTPIQLLVGDGRFGAATVYGAQGTLFDGTLQKVVVKNPSRTFAVDNVNWSFKPLHLFLLRAAADVEFTYLDGKAKGAVGVGVNQKLYVNNFEYKNQADAFTQEFANGFLGLDGDALIQIEQVVVDLKKQDLQDPKMFIQWQKAALAYPVAGFLGNVFLDIKKTEDGQLIKALISNQGGEVSVNGNVVMNAKRGYQADIRIKPTQTITPALSNSLKNASRAGLRPQPDGSYRLLKSGTLR